MWEAVSHIAGTDAIRCGRGRKGTLNTEGTESTEGGGGVVRGVELRCGCVGVQRSCKWRGRTRLWGRRPIERPRRDSLLCGRQCPHWRPTSEARRCGRAIDRVYASAPLAWLCHASRQWAGVAFVARMLLRPRGVALAPGHSLPHSRDGRQERAGGISTYQRDHPTDHSVAAKFRAVGLLLAGSAPN